MYSKGIRKRHPKTSSGEAPASKKTHAKTKTEETITKLREETVDKAAEFYACSVSDLGPQSKKRLTVAERDIFIVKAHEQFYALDSFCYHAGGPLYNGDIEDLGNRTCVKCPWHKYKVCLDTGQNYYQSVDPHNLKKPPQWTAGEVRQRTHMVTVRDGNIYVRLSPFDGTLDSDHHNDKTKEK